MSWKMMAGFGLFLVGGVVVLEIATGTKTPEIRTHENGEIPAANMQAMTQIQTLEQAVAANPGDSKTRLQLANLLHDNRFYDKAIEGYGKYLESNPKDADAMVDLGICLSDVGRNEEGIQWMHKALKVNPNHLLAHFNLGTIYLRSGDLDHSNEWYQKTVALAPNSEVGLKAKERLEQHSQLRNSQTN